MFSCTYTRVIFRFTCRSHVLQLVSHVVLQSFLYHPSLQAPTHTPSLCPHVVTVNVTVHYELSVPRVQNNVQDHDQDQTQVKSYFTMVIL